MPKQALANLTESMFYVLLALSRSPMCGTEIADYVAQHTSGALRLGPATLYTILGKFEKVKYICEQRADGRKRRYQITERGLRAYRDELARLRRCIEDAERVGGMDFERDKNP